MSMDGNNQRKKKVSVIAFDAIPPADDDEDEIVPTSNFTTATETTERPRLNSELDPALVIAATIFVEELVKTAEAEVESRFNQEGRPHESQVRQQSAMILLSPVAHFFHEDRKRRMAKKKTFSLCFCLPKKFFFSLFFLPFFVSEAFSYFDRHYSDWCLREDEE